MLSVRIRRAAKSLAGACALLALMMSARAQNAAQLSAKPPAAATVPTVDQILNRYVDAEGGRAAFEKFTSRTMTGTLSVPSMSLSGTVSIQEKAPNRSLGVVTINGASFRQGFDGTVGWTDDPQNGLREQSGPELAETKRESDFYHTIDMRKLYSKFTLVGKDTINEHEAYVVEAAIPEGGPPEKMYFDTQSGLLLRNATQRHGPDGVSEFQQDYGDYRDVDGVKLPHTIRQTNQGTLVIITVEEYHHNVAIEDGEFAKPGAQ